MKASIRTETLDATPVDIRPIEPSCRFRSEYDMRCAQNWTKYPLAKMTSGDFRPFRPIATESSPVDN